MAGVRDPAGGGAEGLGSLLFHEQGRRTNVHLKNAGLLYPQAEPKPLPWGFLRLPFPVSVACLPLQGEKENKRFGVSLLNIPL